jgi:hypothetical protein
MPDENESGFKWWARYVIVPLVGGGGIITLVIALMNRPSVTPTTSSPGNNPNPTSTANLENRPKKPAVPGATETSPSAAPVVPTPASEPEKHVEIRAYSMDNRVDGHYERLAPNGTRKAHSGEHVMIEWGVSPLRTGEQLYLVIRPRSGSKDARPIQGKGQIIVQPTEYTTYSLEYNTGGIGRIELYVE